MLLIVAENVSGSASKSLALNGLASWEIVIMFCVCSNRPAIDTGSPVAPREVPPDTSCKVE